MRHVPHKILEHPDADVKHRAKCRDCGWRSRETKDSRAVDVACMEHTGRSGHNSFRRHRTSYEVVVRAE
ncbi:hypothetical protein IPZ58_06475 [Streptomyces roseoverticillatus]|uniref:DUF7848 domain-containing protein n=1 Tax=Streptomyces roseoverticillatus TaxID=66429 RepID=UPI001F3C5704|nr:hypothetical protein [Streptomyces roseoverticillatus]MCF3101225.1 hypothetical protein [Streptomyces roseoverticillatus]